MPSQRARNNFYGRCRSGDIEALQTFLYQVSDELYTAALWATDSDQQAAQVLRQTWSRLLRALQRWRFGGYLDTRAFKMLYRILKDEVGADAARHAVDLIASSSADGTPAAIPAPSELVEELVVATREAAPVITRAARARRLRCRLAIAAAGLLIAALIGITGGLWHRALAGRTPQVQFRCLQRHIVEANLMSALREAYAELADPTGADRLRAEAYQRIGLVLEEIANAPSLAELQHLRYIKQRIAGEQLIAAARAAAGDSSDYTGAGLRRIVLVLEEVQNL